jgi:uncharacterized membrane protein
MQMVVGLLLLLFGLRWLHKAVLRAAGAIPLHDEALAFSRQTQALRSTGGATAAGIDAIAFTTTFKTILLEGVEVVFVVIALGLKGGLLLPASAGALLALLLVGVLGLWLHRPLASVPENTLKFAVGVMLTAFGTYWVGEGIGLAWPGQDASILLLILVFLALGAVLVLACRRLHAACASGAVPRGRAAGAPRGALAAVGGELLGLFVEDLGLAAGAAAWVAAAALVQMQHPPATALACTVFTAGVAAVLGASAVQRARGA